jgi:branched-chain amino acid transport system substrate-binding protein
MPMASSQLRVALALCLGLAVVFAGAAARAEEGVSDHKIVFGQVAALSGPAQDLGEGVRLGILTAFG